MDRQMTRKAGKQASKRTPAANSIKAGNGPYLISALICNSVTHNDESGYVIEGLIDAMSIAPEATETGIWVPVHLFVQLDIGPLVGDGILRIVLEAPEPIGASTLIEESIEFGTSVGRATFQQRRMLPIRFQGTYRLVVFLDDVFVGKTRFLVSILDQEAAASHVGRVQLNVSTAITPTAPAVKPSDMFGKEALAETAINILFEGLDTWEDDFVESVLTAMEDRLPVAFELQSFTDSVPPFGPGRLIVRRARTDKENRKLVALGAGWLTLVANPGFESVDQMVGMVESLVAAVLAAPSGPHVSVVDFGRKYRFGLEQGEALGTVLHYFPVVPDQAASNFFNFSMQGDVAIDDSEIMRISLGELSTENPGWFHLEIRDLQAWTVDEHTPTLREWMERAFVHIDEAMDYVVAPGMMANWKLVGANE